MGTIEKIVITGGPCGGKTSGMVKTYEELKNLGYDVFIVPEAATFVMDKLKITPQDCGAYNFQKIIFQTIINFESVGEVYLRSQPGNKKVMLCDRGLLDCAAYISKEQWDMLLKEYAMNLSDIYARYSAVIDIQSVAENMPELYTLENNAARSESVEGAKLLQQSIDVLYGKFGPSFTKIVNIDKNNNPISFEQKKINISNAVLHHLGEPISRELEDMFHVDLIDRETLISISHKSFIEQHYIRIFQNEEERVRKIVFEDNSVYYVKTKKIGAGKDRIEIEHEIDGEMFEISKGSAIYPEPIQKERYSFYRDDRKYELDYFLTGSKKGKRGLECEKMDKDDLVNIPEFLELRECVTDDPSWKNVNMMLA